MKTLFIPRSILIFLLILSFGLTVKAQFNFKKHEPGCYYDTAGIKHIGIIHFRTGLNSSSEIKKIDFQVDSTSESQKINVNEIRSVVVTHRPCNEDSIWGISNKDSLVVIQWRKDKYLAKYVTTLQGIKIFGHFLNSSPVGGGAYTAPEYDFIENDAILDYHDVEPVSWKEFYSRKFSNYPDLVQTIQQIKRKDPNLDDEIAIVRYITHHYPLR